MATRIIQPGELGADYVSTSNKTRDLFTKHGVTFVTRYLKPGTSSYEITAKERDFLFSIGIAITLVFETDINAILGGATQGSIHGRAAAIDAERLEYPHACPIFAAVDTDTYAANATKCEAYLRAFYQASAPWADGLYGDTEAYKLVADRKPVWCKPNAGGWDADRAARAGAHILQGREDKTLGWDYPNVCVHPFTAWTGLGADKPTTIHPPTTTATPAIPLEDHDMANIGIIHLDDADAVFVGTFVGPIDGPRFLDLHWIHDNASQRIADGHIAAGATVFGGEHPTPGAARLHKADLRHCYVDELPHGDSRTAWTSPDDIVARAG